MRLNENEERVSACLGVATTVTPPRGLCAVFSIPTAQPNYETETISLSDVGRKHSSGGRSAEAQPVSRCSVLQDSVRETKVFLSSRREARERKRDMALQECFTKAEQVQPLQTHGLGST